MITPRTTRLVRVPDLQAFRETLVSLACEGDPLAARDRLVVVPTRAAAEHLLRTIEDYALAARSAVILPDLVTPSELVDRLATRLPSIARTLTEAEREVLLGVASRAARAAGAEPPFRLRPGLRAEMLRFYDTLRLNGKDVETFERLALGALEPGATYDRGAERLVRQTRFLVAAFREFERRCQEAGTDIHRLRAQLTTDAAPRPFRHIVLTVTDRAFDPCGLMPAHWDLLARLPGLDRLDLVVTDTVLAGGLHERLHHVLPGIDEVRAAGCEAAPAPALLGGPGNSVLHAARDREEEVAGFARRVRHAVRAGDLTSLDRAALVVRQPLPYVYVARDVLRAGGIPCQLFDALPLASEPYAAMLDLALTCVGSGLSRGPALALLRSPHLDLSGADGSASTADIGLHEIAELEHRLTEAGYAGGVDPLERILASWRASPPGRGRLPLERILRPAGALLRLLRALADCSGDGPPATHFARLDGFLRGYERLPSIDDPLGPRHLRARAAVLGTIQQLRDAYSRFDSEPVPFEEIAVLLRRWIEGQTFAPRSGSSGVHLVDVESARFGSFDLVQMAGLVEGEWPDAPRRNVFYSPSVLRDLGWPADAERVDGARSAFADALRLPARQLVLSAFTLEADAIVTPSPLLDEVERAGLGPVEQPIPEVRIFDYEAMGLEPVSAQPLGSFARHWLERRLALSTGGDPRCQGHTAPHTAASYSLSALERYQDCPFKFFAADVLRLEEPPADASTLTPRARGRFIHEVFQQFFAAWDAEADRAAAGTAPRDARARAGRIGARTITVGRLDAARELFERVAEPLLARLPDADAALERTRLFGSAISLGLVDVVLGLEASRPADVRGRWLEHRLDGEFTLGARDRRRVALRGVADRIDLLEGNRLRIVDYKSGSAPDPRRALQVPIYALCAQEQLALRDGASWTVDDASYVVFSGRRPLVPVAKPGADLDDALAAARERLRAVVDAIERGEFPPRPYDPVICRSCAYSTVCRKDYAGDD